MYTDKNKLKQRNVFQCILEKIYEKRKTYVHIPYTLEEPISLEKYLLKSVLTKRSLISIYVHKLNLIKLK